MKAQLSFLHRLAQPYLYCTTLGPSAQRPKKYKQHSMGSAIKPIIAKFDRTEVKKSNAQYRAARSRNSNNPN